MELGTIEREVYVDAPPEIVFDVVSKPDHVKCWWTDEAEYERTPGAAGEIAFRRDGVVKAFQFAVIDADPPRSFSFRWTHPVGQTARAGNSLLVRFELTPSGEGTLLKLTETGFREMGWEVAVLEQEYQSHVTGWDFYVPRIPDYVAALEVQR